MISILAICYICYIYDYIWCIEAKQSKCFPLAGWPSALRVVVSDVESRFVFAVKFEKVIWMSGTVRRLTREYWLDRQMFSQISQTKIENIFFSNFPTYTELFLSILFSLLCSFNVDHDGDDGDGHDADHGDGGGGYRLREPLLWPHLQPWPPDPLQFQPEGDICIVKLVQLVLLALGLSSRTTTVGCLAGRDR